MSKFTPGKWWIAPPIFDGDAIFAPAQEKGRRNEVVATGILNKADARLIAAAPEMYRLLKVLSSIDEPVNEERCDDLLLAVDEARKVLSRIDGEEAKHEQS